MTTHRILVRTGNPLVLPPEELEDLADAIRQLDTSYDVQTDIIEQKGYGVTWWEVINVILPWDVIISGATGAVITEFIHWARERFKKEQGTKRPKYVGILGPDGKVIRSVVLEGPDAEPEDRTDEDREG